MKVTGVILLLVGVVLIGGAIMVFNSHFIKGAIERSEMKYAESQRLFREAEVAKNPTEKKRLMAEAQQSLEDATSLLSGANNRKLQPTLSAAGGGLAIAVSILLLYLSRRRRIAYEKELSNMLK